MHDRVRFTGAPWNEMLEYVIKKYNNTIHSTTKHTPLEAHKDKNASDVVINLAWNANYKRKYNTINIGDEVKIFTKGRGNYTSRKETVSRWSSETYKVKDIGRDITMNKYYVLEGLQRHFLRHELLLVN